MSPTTISQLVNLSQRRLSTTRILFLRFLVMTARLGGKNDGAMRS